jgi:PKD repeat protein
MPSKIKFLFVFIFCLSALLPIKGYSVNPDLSNYLINLSEGITGPGYDDKVPEIAVSGNTLHVIWVQSVANSEANLYYRRSTDLGETWEASRLIMKFKNRNYATQVASRRLAADGDEVHICAADYDYENNGTGKVHYFRSLNGGSSFEAERIIAATSGGYKAIENSYIKASGGKVVVAYQGTGDKKGSWLMHSANSGTSFSETKLSDESTYVSDLYYDGEKIVVLYGYAYYYYGLNIGKVWASVSQNGTNFTTSKLSVPYTTETGERERCQSSQGDHYTSKIAVSGNHIHVVFTGYTTGGKYTCFYVRSANNGSTFNTAVDIGQLMPENLQDGSETVAAKNGNVYLLAASAYAQNNNPGSRFYFTCSNDDGNVFSEPKRVMNPDVYHVGKSSLPAIIIDPADETGKTLYLTGNWLFSTKSDNGGQEFSGSISLAPFLENNIINMSHSFMNSYMMLDEAGNIHWISQARWRDGTDQDIFYRNVKAQPQPGDVNKAFYVEDLKSTRQAELVVVPSSESIVFDSAMTAEVWVKFNPGTEARFNILAKVEGYDGYDTEPSGYQMGFRQDKGGIYVNAGVKTDKAALVNWGQIDLNDNLWHHIAFTYDARGGLNNFKLYVNGILHQEKTLTGEIVKEDGMLMIGSRQMGDSWYKDARFYIDDVRLWDRALTQKELIENQTAILSGNEQGLMLFLNFDDTFKDISGNHNDGIPVYRGMLHESDFNPPVPDFEMYKMANEVSFNSKTENATSWLWNFNDGTISGQGNPKHVYTTPGEYTVSLLAKNATTVTGNLGYVTIEGLEKVKPEKAGNNGFATIVVYGGGLTPEETVFMLRKDAEVITGDELWSPGPGQLGGRFLMTDALPGKYDVVVSRNGEETILENAFTVIVATLPEPWVSVSGRGMTLFNMWQTYTLNYGNKGNVDALGVPINIVISDHPELEVEFIDFIVEPNDYMKENTPEIAELMDTMYVVVDDYFGPGLHARFYPLYAPVVEASSSHSIRLRIKSPGDFFIETWTHDPFFSTQADDTKSAAGKSDDWPDEKTKLNACIALSSMHAASSSAMDALGLVLPVDCVYDFATFAFNPWDKAKPEHEQHAALQNWGYSLASAAISCIGDLSPVKAVKIGIKIAAIVNNMYQGYLAHQDCLNAFDPRYKNRKGVKAVSSFDPNEMVGPAGFGEKNYIARYSRMPDTVLLEKKKEATAPAHVVTITDTLDLSVFNVSEFSFSSFGWGDSVYSPQGNGLKEFSMDIDLRPEKELITRVSAKLDTLEGIVKWEFLSLNPESMELEEDPFLGFLPPNKTSPEGDGFVSFFAGLRSDLTTNDEILNKASIVFDANEPIITNQYRNTLDLVAPQSKVLPLQPTTQNQFVVEWTGDDEGSGVAGYTIYVLQNDTLLFPWLTNTPDNAAEFFGDEDSVYKFYSIATDNVSHRETDTGEFDTQTTITVDVEEFERMKEEVTVFPNPVRNNLHVKFSSAPCGMYVIELIDASGGVKYSQLWQDFQLNNGINIDVSQFIPGNYFLRMVYSNKVVTKKVMVQ